MEPEAKPIAIALTIAFACSILAACTVLRERPPKPGANGLAMNHPVHIQQGLECSDCHDVTGGPESIVAGHETCSICHDIPENAPTPAMCGICHTRTDYSVDARLTWLSSEIKFDHSVHVSAGVSCTQCHFDLDHGGGRTQLNMEFCMKCHARSPHSGVAESGVSRTQFANNDCVVCHTQLERSAVPKFRHGQRIAHDSPDAWMHLHGAESRLDPAFCTVCHTDELDCQTCHRVMKPANHTPAWTRRIHGLQARWDRQSCAACHDEESCEQCHRTTAPASHRGSFTRGMSTHCVQCHFPTRDDCAVCHQTVAHFTAPPSPHHGDYTQPIPCSECHPGPAIGDPPHLVNLTLDCTSCHL